MHIDVTLGVDRYVGISNQAVGMTAPFSLGVPPVMNQGSIYVPVGLFWVLLGNRPDAVTVEWGIRSPSHRFRRGDPQSLAGMCLPG